MAVLRTAAAFGNRFFWKIDFRTSGVNKREYYKKSTKPRGNSRLGLEMLKLKKV